MCQRSLMKEAQLNSNPNPPSGRNRNPYTAGPTPDACSGPMKYRRFGRTELAMPVISCGGMRYQFKWDDVKSAEIPTENQANLEACIRRALELGINHIETARGYGTSEMQLGRILPTLPREKIIVQTKVAPKASAEEFIRTFDISMSYLGLDFVDLLALHGINNRQLLRYALQRNGCVDK